MKCIMLLVVMLVVYVDSGPVSKDTRAFAVDSEPVSRDTRGFNLIGVFVAAELFGQRATEEEDATSTTPIIVNFWIK